MSKRFSSIFNDAKGHVVNVASNRFGVQPLLKTQDQLEAWLQTSLGQQLLAQQRFHVDQLLHCLFGYHLMQLSISRQLDLASSSPINHRFRFSLSTPLNKQLFVGALAKFEQLPLPSESIDVGVLHHVLDYSPNPYDTLREAARVIIPQGYLVIVGFNPWSLFGLCKPIAQILFSSPRWRYHHLGPIKLVNWLKQLDFEPVCQQYDYYGLPNDSHCARTDLLGRKLFRRCGAFYVLLARKQVARLTPVKSPRKKFNQLPEWGKASPMPQKQG